MQQTGLTWQILLYIQKITKDFCSFSYKYAVVVVAADDEELASFFI